MWLSVILISLFTFSMFAFSYEFINANNPSSPVLHNSAYNSTYSALNTSLSLFQSQVQAQQNISESDKETSTVSVFLILDSILTVPWALWHISIGMVNVLSTFVFAQIFGGSYFILFGVLLGILSGTIIFLITKYIRTGETER